MNIKGKSSFGILLAAVSLSCFAQVNITSGLPDFEVMHNGKTVTVERNQDTQATIQADYALTSRPCPPFCAQPMQAAPGVTTLGEVELIEFMRTRLKDGSGVLVDARTADWFERGTIPGSVNIPFTTLNLQHGANEFQLEEALKRLGVTLDGDKWDFSNAKYAAFWCNGPWCGQSPTAIRGLMSIGYPAEKLLYYRGGMQVWRVFGLTVVSPDGEILDDE